MKTIQTITVEITLKVEVSDTFDVDDFINELAYDVSTDNDDVTILDTELTAFVI